MTQLPPLSKRPTAVVAIDLMVPAGTAAEAYCNVADWNRLFPRTIADARVIKAVGNEQQIIAHHKTAGEVENILQRTSPLQIWLFERKPKFDAVFRNDFEPLDDSSCRFVVSAYIQPRGIYALAAPFIRGYIRRQTMSQVRQYVLEPFKAATE